MPGKQYYLGMNTKFFSMKPLLKPKERSAVGLDIGSSSIKAVVLESREKEFILKNFNVTEISAGTELGSAVKQVLSSMVVNADYERINISLSGQSVVIRYVWLPLMSEKDLLSSLKFEAAKLIPFAIEEVNIDSFILKQDVSNNKMLVLIVAAKKDAVSERIRLVQNIGFKIGIIDVDSLSLINAFNFNHHYPQDGLPKTLALLNIGASVSNLNILEEGIPVFSRDIYIAGNNFSKKLADSMGIDFRAAENLKRNPDEAMRDKIISCVESILSNLASEIRISFDYYETQGASSVEKIFLSGGGSILSNLKDNLSPVLGIDIDYWDPTQRLSVLADSSIEKIKSYSAQIAVALGLAMR